MQAVGLHDDGKGRDEPLVAAEDVEELDKAS